MLQTASMLISEVYVVDMVTDWIYWDDVEYTEMMLKHNSYFLNVCWKWSRHSSCIFMHFGVEANFYCMCDCTGSLPCTHHRRLLLQCTGHMFNVWYLCSLCYTIPVKRDLFIFEKNYFVMILILTWIILFCYFWWMAFYTKLMFIGLKVIPLLMW